MDAAHPEFVIIDRDGYIREHKRGWWGEDAMNAATLIVQQLVGEYAP